MKKLFFLILFSFTIFSCSELNQVIENMPPMESGSGIPSNFEIAQGLKAALEKGTLEGVSELSKPGGYLKKEMYKIYFPENAQKAEKTLRDIGLGNEVDRLVASLNEAAENAVTEAKPLFVSAIKEMTFSDVKEILFGADTAATSYLKRKTSMGLHQRFEPHIQQSLNQVNATKYWSDIMTQYNKIPFVEKVETDLANYVTNRAIAGLFLKIAEEEMAIRENPQERTSTLLKKVFGYADKQK